jgi:arylsulfatase
LATGVQLFRSGPPTAQARTKPNIVVIMGDDIGIWNIGAYHQGLMESRTRRQARVGGWFTVTTRGRLRHGRASITGSLPDWHDPVNEAGAAISIPET